MKKEWIVASISFPPSYCTSVLRTNISTLYMSIPELLLNSPFVPWKTKNGSPLEVCAIKPKGTENASQTPPDKVFNGHRALINAPVFVSHLACLG
jgi:hypothetical protein